MILRKRLPWLVLLQTLLVVSAAGQRQKPAAPEQTEPPVPKSIVKGRVVYDDNNSPVRRSKVMLMQLPERGPQLSSATGRDGRFEIYNVPPGVYFVAVDSPGLITPFAFMKFNETGPPETFDVKEVKEYCTQVAVDGSNNVDVTIRARRGGAISGRVTYNDGSSAVNTMIAVLRKRGDHVSRVITGVNGAALLGFHTDDRGRYRISGLPPGDYLVSAAETNTAPGRGGGDGGPLGDLFRSDALAISYYGSAAKIADAVTLKVEAGSELNNIDITLSDDTPHTISGSVVARSGGRILPGATLSIKNKEDSNWFERGQQRIGTDDQGQWLFDDVPDGTYLISVEPPPEPPPAQPTTADDEDDKPQKTPTRKFVPKETEVTVSGSDLAGVVIELVEGATVSGTVELPAGIDRERTYVMVRYAYEGQARGRTNDTVGAYDGTFTFEQLRAGKIYLTAEANANEENAKLYVKSITLNGTDLMQKPLTVESGQSVTNVRIVLGSDAGRAKIQLLDSAGKPVPAKPVLILSTNPGKWSFSNQFASDVTDVNGTVSFSGAPGEYLLMVAGPDETWPPSTDTIRTRSETAARFKLQPGDNKTVSVTVVR